METVKIYAEDAYRVAKALQIHEASVTKEGGVQLFESIVLDAKGQPLGKCKTDEYGKSYFSEVGK